MNYLGNAFSLQMLQDEFATIETCPIDRADIPDDCESVIGHQDLADYLGVPMCRANITLDLNDTLYVAQFSGGRLPEGTSLLDAEQKGMLKFYRITVDYPIIRYQAQQMLDYPEDYGLI
jgi:hypothetical protein